MTPGVLVRCPSLSEGVDTRDERGVLARHEADRTRARFAASREPPASLGPQVSLRGRHLQRIGVTKRCGSAVRHPKSRQLTAPERPSDFERCGAARRREVTSLQDEGNERSHLARHGSAIRLRCRIERTKQRQLRHNFAHTAFWELAK